MKTLKNAKQQNVVLNKDFYLESDLRKMLVNEEIFFISKDFKPSYSYDEYENTFDCEGNNVEFRIFTSNTKEIKVVYNKKYEYYETIVIGNNDKLYHINLK